MCVCVCVCVCACVRACVRACVSVRVFLYVCMYVCMYACMYVCLHVRMHACMYMIAMYVIAMGLYTALLHFIWLGYIARVNRHTGWTTDLSSKMCFIEQYRSATHKHLQQYTIHTTPTLSYAFAHGI